MSGNVTVGTTSDVFTVSVVVNGGKQPLSCSIADTATSCSDSSDTVSVAAEDTIAVYLDTTLASSGAQSVMWSLELG